MGGSMEPTNQPTDHQLTKRRRMRIHREASHTSDKSAINLARDVLQYVDLDRKHFFFWTASWDLHEEFPPLFCFVLFTPSHSRVGCGAVCQIWPF